MIFVAGGTGNVGRALLGELHAAGVGPLRGMTRDRGRARGLPDGVEVVEGDLRDEGALRRALDGVRGLFLPSRVGDDALVVRAAREAGVEHVVLVSSITVETHPHLGPARENLAVEELLRGSGLEWTVLRPTQFASNCLMWAEGIRARREVRAPFADVALPTVHPADIASVARVALTEPGHRGRMYALTGPETVTPREQVAAIAGAVGADIGFGEISRGEAYDQMAAVFGAEAADAVLDVSGGDVNDALAAVRDTVSVITGRDGRRFTEWAAENAHAFR